VRLVRVPDDHQLWSEDYDRKLTDVLDLQDNIARSIAQKLRFRLAGGDQQNRIGSTDKLTAYDLYLKGRYFWNKRTEQGLRKGAEYFQKAVAEDPHYALAYTGLADSYNILGANGAIALKRRLASPKRRRPRLWP
jgi:adenylate cyclase